MKPDETISASILMRSGVYGWRRHGKYLYIGQSLTIMQRIRRHHVLDKKEPLKHKDHIDIWFCPPSELLQLEKQLIELHNPSLNSSRKIRELTEDQKRYDTFREAAIAHMGPKKWKEYRQEHFKNAKTEQEELSEIQGKTPGLDIESLLKNLAR